VLVRDDVARAPETIGLPSGETILVEYDADDPHAFTPEERVAIAEVARDALPDVRRVLPSAPASLVLHVRSAGDGGVIPETGENASNALPNAIYWRVDPTRHGGVAAIARIQLRPTLFHEIHHLVRAGVVRDTGVRGDVIREGLATAFERDFGGGAPPPWGQYPPEVEEWTREVLALPHDAPRETWLFRHPDGRRWIGYRVGTFVADCAARATGKTSAAIVGESADAVFEACPATRGGPSP
jgi:Predicted Zn-dependent protease (DUF2268)